MPGLFNLDNEYAINQGEDYYLTFKWLQGDGSSPVKLDGYTGKSQIRSYPQSSDVLAEFEVIIVDAANGAYALSLTADQTAAIPTTGNDPMKPNVYSYDVNFTSASGASDKVLKGNAYIYPGVTR